MPKKTAPTQRSAPAPAPDPVSEGPITCSAPDLLVSIGLLPARCATRTLTARQLGELIGVTERRVNQLRPEFNWPTEGPLPLSAVSDFIHRKTAAVTVTREPLRRAAAEHAAVFASDLAIWIRAGYPPAELVECFTNMIFDAAVRDT